MLQSSKKYMHNLGYSTVFRQWKASSHCRFPHGYALAFRLTFQCEDDEVDERGWTQDFGGLKPVKNFLDETFDHTFIAAEDDPELSTWKDLAERGLLQLRIIPAVGCENFAKYVFHRTQEIMAGLTERNNPKAKLISVEVSEHDANSATYFGSPL